MFLWSTMPPTVCLSRKRTISLKPISTNKKRAHNSAKCLQHFVISKSGHLDTMHMLSGSPDTLFTRSFMGKCLSLERGVIQTNIHRILWKVNQVIYTMYPNSMPEFQDPITNRSWPYAKRFGCTHAQTHGETGPSQYAPSTSLKLVA